jgi:hypothetical protein
MRNLDNATSNNGCQFLTGGAARFCGAPVLPRTSYCGEHYRRVYMKPSDRVPVAFQINMAVKGPAADYARRAAMGRQRGWDDDQG